MSEESRALRVAPLGVLAAAVLFLGSPCPAGAGAFIRASETTPDMVTHPTGYDGTGGVVTVEVCIDPASPNAARMELSVQNAVATWNAQLPSSQNLFLGENNDIASGGIDFESTVLHEIGHCIGLAHPNLASESGETSANRNYTKAGDGANDVLDLDAGTDAVIGSSDDARGDDVNLHWFKKSDNDPFTSLPSTIDASTYSRAVADLPGGDAFAANGDRSVGVLLGFTDAEAVMQQGAFFDEAQRELTADDVATLRLAMSGVDMSQGTTDDYTITLSYAGLQTGCDIEIAFDDVETGFAVCQTSTNLFASNHREITLARIFFNGRINWFFTAVCGDGVIAGEEECDDGGTAGGDGCDATCEIESGWLCSGDPSVCDGDCGDGVVVGSEQCDDGGTEDGDCCSASCELELVGSPCDDGDLCNASDTCDGSGGCVSGSPVDCDDVNVCTDDSCDPGSGCVNSPNTAPCEDGSACTVSDFCAGGICIPGGPLECDDADVCTDDGCDPGSGCANTPNTAPCDDGDACTDGDTCAGGVCSGGGPLDCDDVNVCTADGCDQVAGCFHDPIPFCGTGTPSAPPWGRALLGALLLAAGALLLAQRRYRPA